MPRYRKILFGLCLLSPLAGAESPQYWPQQWPPGWYPPPYYPMQPPSPGRPAPATPSEATPAAGQPDTPAAPTAVEAPPAEIAAEAITPGDSVEQAIPERAEIGTTEIPPAMGPASMASPDEPVQALLSGGESDDGDDEQAAPPPGLPPWPMLEEAVETVGPESEPGLERASGQEPGQASVVMDSAPVASGQSAWPEVVAESDDVDRAARHQEALQAMRAGNYAEAFCLWRPLAQAGDAQAQFSLGWMYHNGYGLAIDDRKTLALWQEAAAQDFADAAFALGMLFSFGDGGVKPDLSTAVENYLHAIRLGHADARQMLRNLIHDKPRKIAGIVAAWGDAEWALLGSPARVRVARANVRKGPSTQTKVVASLKQDDRVLALGERGHWIQVVLPQGRLAWVYGKLLEVDPTESRVSLTSGDQVSNR